jgi:IgGFc binding protein
MTFGATCSVVMRRRVLLLILGLDLSACICAVACGSEDRPGFDRPSPTVEDDADGAPTNGFQDATAEPPAACRGQISGPSPAGCRFVVTESTWSTTTRGSPLLVPNEPLAGCHVLLVSNPSPVPVRLRLRFKDREEDAAPFTRLARVEGRDVTYLPLPDGTLPPKETAVVSAFFFEPEEPVWKSNTAHCPTAAFVEGEEPQARAGKVTPSVELLSDAPVVVAQTVEFQKDARPMADAVSPGLQSFSTLFSAFPVEAWDSAPIETGIFKPGLPAELYNPDSGGGPAIYTTYPSRSIVTSAFDGTIVLLPQPDGSTRTVTLQRGEVFAHDPDDALIGRAIPANHPIGVVTYTPRAFIPWEYPFGALWADAARVYQASMPTRLWGSEYVAVRHGDRWPSMPERPPWRVLGGADGTALTYEPYRPEGAPEHLERGELAVFFADEPFVARSQDEQHPFYLGAHMTGPRYQKQRFGDSDPFGEVRGTAVSTFALATSRWQKAYPFFALPRYPEHSLVVVRKAGSRDVRLDCAGVLTGWQPVGASFEYVRVPLTGHLFEPIAYPDGTCHAGSHWIESADLFWATLWAWGNGDTFQEVDVGSDGAYALPLLGAEVHLPGETR